MNINCRVDNYGVHLTTTENGRTYSEDFPGIDPDVAKRKFAKLVKEAEIRELNKRFTIFAVEDLVEHYDQISQWVFWRDNRELYLVTGWKPEQDSVRMGVDYHAAAVKPIGHDGIVHTTIQPMSEFFRFENGEEVHL